MIPCLSLLCFMVFGPPAVALDGLNAAAPVPAPSVQAYRQVAPLCTAWTDGCVVCTSGEDDKAHCSMPGIACTPHAIVCRRVRNP